MLGVFRRIFERFSKSKEPEETLVTTTTPPVEVVSADLPKSEVDIILDKTNRKEEITLREINLILAERLNTKSLESTTFKLNDTVIKNAVFLIDTAAIMSNDGKHPTEIKFILSEVCYGLKMELTVSSHDFHDIFHPFDFKTPEMQGVDNDTES